MPTISPRFKHAFKAALAVVIAYAIALYMDWDTPYWSGWTALTISLDKTGQSIQKGLNRVFGAVVGSVAGFILLAFFIQDRWLFFTFFSLFVALCIYFGTGTERYNYFWQQAGFFAVVVGFDSAFNPASAFEIAIERTQGSGTGLLVYLLIGLLLWPTESRSSLENAGCQLTAGLKQLFGSSMASMLGQPLAGAPPPWAQLAALQNRFDSLLDAAKIDSWEVDAVRPAWQRCREQMAGLRETLERWQQNFKELENLDLQHLVPSLPAFGAEIDARLTEIKRMFAADAPGRQPSPITLKPDEQARETLSHFDRAALTVTLDRLAQLEAATGALFASVNEIRGFPPRAEAAAGPNKPPAIFTLDRDRLGESLRIAASAWLAFLVIVYVPDVPGELGTIGLITRIVIADTKFAWIPVPALIRPTFAGILFAFPIYIFLMPKLSGFAGLAVLLFAVVFVIDYRFHDPKQTFWRILIPFLFMSLAGIKNQQSYSFLHFANTALQWSLLFLLLSLTEYLPVSQQPDRVCLRMLGRFFQSCEFLMTTVGWNPQQKPPRAVRWRKTFHEYEVAALPGKLAAWGRFLPPAALGRTTPEQVQALAMRLQTLAYRMQELLEARSRPQSTLMVRELLADVRRWRVAVLEIFGQLSEKPEATEPASLRSRLDALLVRLETRIQESIDKAESGEFSAEESGNMYRLLGAHRGVSEAVVDFAKQAARIDWARLREERF